MLADAYAGKEHPFSPLVSSQIAENTYANSLTRTFLFIQNNRSLRDGDEVEDAFGWQTDRR